MSEDELEVLRVWANTVLESEDGKGLLTLEEMNGTISLLHKGGDTVDKPGDWRPVVLLNDTNQLIMHVLNMRLRKIVTGAGIIEPGQAGGQRGRSADVNMAKLDWVTRAACEQQKRVYRVDVDFKNAYNAMAQSALWGIMRELNIPDVDLLETLYEGASVRLAPNGNDEATITFDTGVA